LATHEVVAEDTGTPPVLLLDDVFSELDPSRRAWLADAVRSIGQTLVSTAEPVALDVLGPGATFEVTSGTVTPGA
jgi:DNA replication and repair protein RecF